MKKILLVVTTAFYLAGCENNDGGINANSKNTESEKKVIELTCTPEKFGSQEYISIDLLTRSVIDNGQKSEGVIIEKGRIVYETTSSGKKFIVKIDRTSGKMEVTEPSDSENKLNYVCELVKQKF